MLFLAALSTTRWIPLAAGATQTGGLISSPFISGHINMRDEDASCKAPFISGLLFLRDITSSNIICGIPRGKLHDVAYNSSNIADSSHTGVDTMLKSMR